MTDEKRALIENLAEIYAQKREHWEALGMQNTSGKTKEERVQMAKDYAVAEAEMLEANANLKSAQQP